MKSLPALIAALIAACCLGSCLQSEDDPEPSETEPLSTDGVSRDYSYVARGNTLFITRDQVWRRCLGDSLAADTLRDKTDTIEFELNGDSWRHFKSRETLNSGAVVRWARTYQRMEAGSGLEGVWIRPEDSYHVVSGSLASAEKMEHEEAMRNAKLSTKYREDRLTVTDDTYIEYSDIRSAAEFVDFWNGKIIPGITPESAVYDIEVTIVDRYTVELKGRKNHETVKLSRFPNWDLSITSSNPDNSPLRFYGEPKSCPNPQEPVWYKPFLDANRKGG